MIKFYLKAEPDFHGKPRVLEFYELQIGPKSGSGDKVAYQVDLQGLVDEDVKTQNAKAYADFSTLVQANQEALYGEAIASGAKVYPEKFLASSEPVVAPEAKKAKKAKE